MKMRPVAAAMSAAAILALSACGHGTGSHAASRVSAAATSTAVAADRKTAEALVKPCMPADQAVLLTRSGRAAFASCMKIAPGKRAAFESCVLAAAQHDLHPMAANAARKSGEHAFALAAAGCAEAAR